MTYSPKIQQLARILRGFGWRVDLLADLRWPDGRPFSGRCRHHRREIEIGCSSAREAFMVLAHEAGHALAAERGGPRYHRLPEERREILAYLYGWGVMIALDAPVTKADWRAHHDEPREDTAQLPQVAGCRA